MNDTPPPADDQEADNAAGASCMARFVRRLLCTTGNHQYREVQRLSEQSRRVACPDCGGVWAMNDDTRSLLPWNPDFHRMYERHGIKIEYREWEFRKYNVLPTPQDQ